jgi:hypothetical protein
MRIRQRRLLVVVVTVALAAAVLPFPGSTPQRSSTPRPVEQALAVPVAPAGAGDGY